jgi:ATP-binding cassette subfamily B protein
LLGAIREAELDALLGSLPEGLQTSVGDGGCRLSGGEGQRLRFARGLLAPAPQLVLLDEPFRGLDRTQRARLLTLARRKWRQATLLCVTHDIAETLDFARVLVVHAGRIVEDGRPRELALRRDCHYADMLQRERSLRDQLANSASFRHWRIEHGDLVEQVAHRAHSQTIELTPSASASPHSEEALP